jgi:hypothetical protein
MNQQMDTTNILQLSMRVESPYPNLAAWRNRNQLREPLHMAHGVILAIVCPDSNNDPLEHLVYCLEHKANPSKLILGKQWGLPSETRRESFNNIEPIAVTVGRLFQEELGIQEEQVQTLTTLIDCDSAAGSIDTSFRMPARAIGGTGPVLVSWVNPTDIDRFPTEIDTEEISAGRWFRVQEIVGQERRNWRFRQYPNTYDIIQRLLETQWNSVPWFDFSSLTTSHD